MRQRNIKNLDERIEANANYLIEDPRACRGHWREIFKNDHPIYLEIGCGKGKFITAHAEREPNCNFIACEGQASVVLRALEKAEDCLLYTSSRTPASAGSSCRTSRQSASTAGRLS